jgi:tryptophan halogenase
MSEPLEIVIVGGGTAGWMTAAGLTALLPPRTARVRLIESDDIGTVGVGEATLPQLKDFNNRIGIIEAEMMARSFATFKLGIEFVDWGPKGASYIHPFGVFGRAFGGAPFHQCWSKARLGGTSFNIEDFCYAIVASRKNRFEFPAIDPSSVNAGYSYAYHLDAGLYARFLRDFAEARGLRRTEGRIVEIALDPESGNVKSLRLESGESVTGDLFIDCSGFRALLIGEALKVPYEDWNKWLPCDAAFAVPSERGGELTPYTRATAREAGWQWRIPLQHRTGNGYVFSHAFIKPDEARAKLMSRLDGPALAEPRLVRFQPGRRTASWSKNCVSIGLASGFLEPLESTSIYLIQVAILNLLKLFPRKQVDPALASEFNRLVDLEYDRVRDFLILHYHANGRDDSELWRYCRNMDVPDSLREKIAIFAHRGYVEKYKDGLFAPPSWIAVLIGQGVVPERYEPVADNVAFDEMLAEMNALRDQISSRVGSMPRHADFSADYCAAAEPNRASAKAGTRP